MFLFTRGGVEPSEVMEHDIRIKATMACLDVNKRVVIQNTDCPLRNIRCDPDDVTQQEEFKLNWVVINRIILQLFAAIFLFIECGRRHGYCNWDRLLLLLGV